MLPRTIKAFTVFADGESYAGRTKEITLPDLSRKMEEFRSGGMLAPIEIDVGLEKLETKMKFAEHTPLLIKLFGRSEVGGVPLTFKGSAEGEDGTVKSVEVVMRGRWKKLTFGSFKGGDQPEMEIEAPLVYFKYSEDGVDLVEIDIMNTVFKIDGNDLYEDRRKALGL